jgi:hypothetical protein
MVWLLISVSDAALISACLFVNIISRVLKGLLPKPFVFSLLVALIGHSCSLDGPGHLFDSFLTITDYCTDLELFRGCCLDCFPYFILLRCNSLFHIPLHRKKKKKKTNPLLFCLNNRSATVNRLKPLTAFLFGEITLSPSKFTYNLQRHRQTF